MLNSIKVAFVLVLFYFPFLFLILIPSNSIFLRPQELKDNLCSRINLPVVCHNSSVGKSSSVTLAVIKPDGMAHQEEILKMIQGEGLKIISDRTTQLDEAQVSIWYQDKQTETYYPSLVQYLTRGPIRILVLKGKNAVPKLRSLIGPTNPDLARQSFPKSVRALYGANIQENVIHASDSEQSAKREIEFLSTL